MATQPGMSAATQYGMFADHANQAYKDALTNIQNQRADLLKNAGLEGVYDQNGILSSTRVAAGAGSQFGGYQQMMHGMAGAGEQMDAQQQGLGFGGGLANQMGDQAHKAYEGQYNDFGTGVLSGITGLGQQQLQAGQDYNDSLFQQQQALGYDPTKADFSGLPAQTPDYGAGNQDNGPYGQNNNTNPSGTHPNRPFTGRGANGYGRGLHGVAPKRRRRR